MLVFKWKTFFFIKKKNKKKSNSILFLLPLCPQVNVTTLSSPPTSPWARTGSSCAVSASAASNGPSSWPSCGTPADRTSQRPHHQPTTSVCLREWWVEQRPSNFHHNSPHLFCLTFFEHFFMSSFHSLYFLVIFRWKKKKIILTKLFFCQNYIIFTTISPHLISNAKNVYASSFVNTVTIYLYKVVYLCFH